MRPKAAGLGVSAGALGAPASLWGDGARSPPWMGTLLLWESLSCFLFLVAGVWGWRERVLPGATR